MPEIKHGWVYHTCTFKQLLKNPIQSSTTVEVESWAESKYYGQKKWETNVDCFFFYFSQYINRCSKYISKYIALNVLAKQIFLQNNKSWLSCEW